MPRSPSRNPSPADASPGPATRPGAPPDSPPTARPAPPPDAEGEVLLALARAAIAGELGIRLPADDRASWLLDTGACFVTLLTHGRMHGCIGSIEPRRTLLEDVRGNARSAAFRDRRFPALTAAELDHTVIEVSVLSATTPMAFTDETDALAQLRPHVDGVVFECGGRRSTLLPQVWRRVAGAEEFLVILKRKAGLPATFRSDQMRLSRYTVTEYHEGG